MRENKWRAARYGLDAEIIVDDKGQQVRSLRESILELASDLEPVARELGCADELGKVEQLLQVGASYQRQRAVAAAHDGDLRAVVDSLMAEMDDGVL